MNNTVISVEHLTKKYDLGVISTGTLSRDLNRWWARLRGQSDPYSTIGQRDHFERIGESILALDDVSFKVEQGEALGVIGKNGAGKSTLLKILSRVTAPTSGVVKVKGRMGSLLEVGTGFHPELTGRENVYLNGAILGMRKDEVDRKFDEIVDFSGVEKFIDTPVKRYSSGMYVRLAFAVAAHLDPEILVVDEVLAVGDAEFQKKCLGKMGDVAGEGRTVLFVSHNMAMIETLCTSSILLDDGKLIEFSNTEEVIEIYLNKVEENATNSLVKRDLDDKDKIAMYTQAKLLDKDKQSVNSIQMGEDLIIQLDFISHQRIRTPKFGVRLYNSMKQDLISWRTNETYGEMPPIKKGGTLFLHIRSLNLLPGIYHLALGVSDGYQNYDYVEDALTIEITPKAVYSTGKIPKRSIIYTPCIWEPDYE